MLSDRALLVTLSLGLPPLSKLDKRITRDIRHTHGTEKLRASKSLLPDTAIEPVRKIQREAYEWHRKNTVAWGENSERLLASAHFMEYSDKMGDFVMKHDAAADEFTRNYPLYVDEARRQLNGAFNAQDYPSQSVIRNKFKLSTEFLPVPDAGDFRISIQREEMEELRASVNRRVQEAENHARMDLAGRIAAPLAAMAERLRDKDAVFRDSLVGNLREICGLIPALNITDDPKLEAARKAILADLCGADPELLRENATVRSVAARKAQSILDTMNSYFSPAPEALAA